MRQAGMGEIHRMMACCRLQDLGGGDGNEDRDENGAVKVGPSSPRKTGVWSPPTKAKKLGVAAEEHARTRLSPHTFDPRENTDLWTQCPSPLIQHLEESSSEDNWSADSSTDSSQ